MTFSIEDYSEKDRAQWNYLVDNSFNGTFMHKREFLDYHDSRFKDCSLLVYKEDSLCAVFPAAALHHMISSHPGLTFGGLVYNDRVRGTDISLILSMIKSRFHKTPIIYKAVPVEFQRHAVKDDIWALHSLKATRTACELSSVLNPLTTNYEYWPIRKEELSSLKDNITLSAMPLHDIDFLENFWSSIVIPNLSKYNIKPTHSAKDIHYLFSKFPVFIKGLLATHTSGKLLGGLILFRFNKCYHVQYSVTNSKGRALHALSLLHHYMIETLPSDVHYYNFGKSTEENGLQLNKSLYYYKNSFGGGSMVYETYVY